MRNFVLRVVSRSRFGALAFTALIGIGAASTNGAFAGGSPSWINLKTTAPMTESQVVVVQDLVVEKLQSPDVSEEQKVELAEILKKLKIDSENENTEDKK
jgi:hypothetical protein